MVSFSLERPDRLNGQAAMLHKAGGHPLVCHWCSGAKREGGRIHLPGQNGSNTRQECEGRIFRNKELEGRGPNRGGFAPANPGDDVSDLIEADVGVDHEEGRHRDIVECGGRELDQGVGEFEGRVDADSLAGQLEFSKNGTRQKPSQQQLRPSCQARNKLSDEPGIRPR